MPSIVNFVIILTFSFLYCFGDNNFGNFQTSIRSLTQCQGPKRKNCTNYTLSVLNDSATGYDMDVNEPVTVTHAKILAAIKNKPPLRFQMNNPCKHMFIKPFLTTLFNATEKNCKILKNHYHIELDMAGVSQRYYNGMFLYGNWTFTSMFFSDQCNFLCTVLDAEIMPRQNV